MNQRKRTNSRNYRNNSS